MITQSLKNFAMYAARQIKRMTKLEIKKVVGHRPTKQNYIKQLCIIEIKWWQGETLQNKKMWKLLSSMC